MSTREDRFWELMGNTPKQEDPKSNTTQSNNGSTGSRADRFWALMGDTPSKRSGFDFNQGVGMYNTTIDSFSKWYDESMAGLSEMGRDNINLTETNEMAGYYLRRVGALRQWANENKDLLGDSYQDIMDSLQQMTTATYWMDRGHKNQADTLLANFKTIDEYDQYMADKAQREEKAKEMDSFDMDAALWNQYNAWNELDAMRSAYNDLDEIKRYQMAGYGSVPEAEREALRSQHEQRLAEITEKYGVSSPYDLMDMIYQQEQQYKQMGTEIDEVSAYRDSNIGSSTPWEETPKKTAEDYRNELAQLEQSIASMSNYIDVLDARYAELDAAIAMYSSSSDPEDISRLATAQNELNTLLTQRNNANQEYDSMMTQKWQLEHELKYDTLAENADFKPGANYKNGGVNTGSNFNVTYVDDNLYRLINSYGPASVPFNRGGIEGKFDTQWINDNGERFGKYHNMTAEEIANYNYLYHTQGADAALEYLLYLEPQIDARATNNIAGRLAEMTQSGVGGAIAANALSVPLNLVGGIGYLDLMAQNVARDIRGDYAPINYNSAAMLPTHMSRTVRQTTAGMITDATGTIQLDPEKNPFWAKILNGRGLADVYQLGMSMVDSRVAAMTGNGYVATGLLASSAATQGVLDALERGATDEQALQVGLWNGIAEAVFEFFEVENLLKGDPNWIRATMNQALTEGIGEGATTVANNISDFIIMTDKSQLMRDAAEYEKMGYDRKTAVWNAIADAAIDAGWDILGGAASGGISAAGMSAVQNATNTRNTGRYVQENKMEDPLMALANQMAGLGDYQGKVEKYAQKTTQRPNAYNVGRLYNETTRVIDQQNMDQLAEALQKQGMTKSEATKLASAIALDLNGIELTKAQERLLEKHEGSEAFTNAVVEVLGSDAYMNRNNALRKMHGEAPMTAQAAPRQTKTEEKTEVTQPKVETTHAVSEDGETHLVAEPEKTVSIQGIEEIKDGTMKLRMDDGTVVDAGEVSFATPDEAMVYSALADMGMNVNAANLLASAFKTADISGEAYTLGIRQAYQLGQNNDRLALAKGEYSSALTEHQRDVAFKMGKIFGGQQTAKAEATIRKARKNAPKNATEKTGKVHFERNGRTFDDVRETALKTMEQLSAALGTEFYVYESYVNKKGQRVYKDENGIEVKAPNGWYDPATGAIHIDLNAGMSGKGTMLFTIAHELTHFIRQWSPAKFKVLANFLVEQYNQKGQSVEELIEARLARAKRNGNDDMTRDIAFEEVVADSMESMLKSGNVVETMALLKQQDKSLWQKIVDWFKDLAEDLKKLVNAYKDVKPDSVEGKMVEDMQDVIVILESLYADALIDAGENYKALNDLDVNIDTNTESVAPAVLLSERTWTESDYVQEREEAALAISKAIGVTTEKAKQYIDDINSIAKMIAEDRTRLDYFSSPYRSSFVSNVEYGGSFDFSTLCKKRRLLTGTFTAIQKALPNTALTADEILDIRNRMKDAGLEVSCGLCYVEGSRANMGQFSKEFLRLYKQYYPDAWQPNMADVNTPDGIEWVRINHPECYEQYEYFWNHYGTLKPGDKNLFASQQKPKLYQLHTEYKGEILQKFNADNVGDKNDNGGIRLQSFSDFEIVHLIDTMQIIMDMSRVGLAGQAYTKVPDFAWALGDTGLKINLSLIAKGVDENGKLVFDDVEGMPIAEAMRLRDRYSENVGTILVAFNDQQLMAAMADDRVDFIIPFHRSQWKKSQYEAMGLPAKTKDYTYMQNEKYIKPQYHEYRGRMVKDKATNYMPNDYWDFNKSGKENAIDYLEMCARNNKRPKFYKLLTDNKDGSYSLKADGSTDGYWKLLIDFKMYDNQGKGSPQRPVRPDFNMSEANRMLDDYKGGHSSFPVAQGIVDQFVAEYRDSHKGKLLSDRDAGAERVAETLRKENGKLKEDVKHLKELLKLQRSVTNGTRFTRSSVEAAAGMLMKSVNARGDKAQLTELLNGFYEYIAAGEDLTWENVMEKAEPISDWLMRNQVEKHELDGFAQDVLRDIRGSRFYLDDQQKQNVAYKYGSYNEFRKKMMGTAVVSDKANMSLDSWWHDMAGQYPSIFDETISSSDMPEAFADAIDRLRSMEIDPYGYDFDREMMARDIMYQVYDSYWNVSTLKTVADVKQKQINELKGKHADRIEKIRAEHRESRARLQKQFRSELAAVKKDMRKAEQEHIQKAVERQRQIAKDTADRKRDNAQKAEMRRKIRKTIRDLDKLFSRGDKKKNVKEEMRDLAATVLASAEVLFMDSYTENDMIRDGVTVTLSERESRLLNQAMDIMAQLDNPPADPAGIEAWYEQEPVLKQKLARLKAQLKEVFERQRNEMDGMTVKSLLQQLSNSYADLMNSEDSFIRDAFDENVYEHLLTIQEGLGYAKVKDMRLDQLEALYDAYNMVLTTIRNANKLFDESIKETKQELANKIMIEESMVAKRKPKTKAGSTVSKFMWNNLKPVYAFERIGSKTLSTLYGNIRKGQDSWAIDMREANEFRKGIQEKYGYDSWDMDKVYTFKTNSGADFNLTLEQLMSIYAYSKRAQAYDHMMKGGFVFDDNTTTTVNKLGIPVEMLNEDASTYKVSLETMSEIVGALTQEQAGFVDEMQDYLSSTMGEKGNSVSLKLYGIKLFNEKNYFPLKSAGQYMAKAKEADLKKQQGQINIASSGFTKAVAPKASNPIVLSGFMDVWSGHVNEMSMYHSFVLPMEDFRKVYNYSTPNEAESASASVNAAIQNAHGKAATSYIDQLYKDLNGGALSDSREGLAKSLVGKFKKAAVMASLSVVFQQPSAIGRAFSEVDLKHFHGPAITKGTARAIFAPKRHDALWSELKKYAPVAMIKEMGYFDTGMGMSAQEYLQAKEYTGIKEKAKAFIKDSNYRDEVLSKGAAVADELTWIEIWKAVKNETAERNPDMKRDSEEFLKIAGNRFSEVIDKTQVYDSVLARSANMRSKSLYMNMATSFMAEPTTTMNMVWDALTKAANGQKKAAARAIGSVAVSIIINAALSSIIYAARDDDEDETYLEKYFSSFFTDIVDSFNPITYIPIIKDIWSIAQGFDVERADMSLMSDLMDKLKSVISIYNKDTSEMGADELKGWKRSVRDSWIDLTGVVANLLGIPARNMIREVRGAANMFSTLREDFGGRKTTWMSFGDVVGADLKSAIPVLGWSNGKKKAEKLFDALQAGDQAYADRLMASYDDEKKVQTAISGVVKDKYQEGEISESEARDYLIKYCGLDITEAYWKMKEWDSDKESTAGEDFKKYDRFYDAVKTGANLKAVIKEYTDNGVKPETLRGQITEYFKPEYVNMSASDRAGIKGYLLNAMVACGQEREKAEITMMKWDFEASYGYTWDDRADAYRNGAISASKLVDELMKISGKTKEEAELQVEVYDWQKDIPNCDITATGIRDYHENCESAGISRKEYYTAWRYYQDTSGEIDEDTGESIPYSKVKKVMVYINGLDLTAAQKTALASCWWGASTVKEYKLW